MAADGAVFATALRQLATAEPPLYLSPSPDLSRSARAVAQHIFSSLKPHTPKLALDQLLIDGFDAEQIWLQIDLQSQPLLANLRHEVRKFEKNPQDIRKLFGDSAKAVGVATECPEPETNGFEGLDEVDDAEDDEEEEESDSEMGEGESEEEEVDGGNRGVEDKFLKLKELEGYLEEDEAREYGLGKKKKKGKKKEKEKASDEEGDDDDDEDNEDEFGLYGAGMDDDDDEDEMVNARYEDFFGSKKKVEKKRKPEIEDESEDSDVYGEEFFGSKKKIEQKRESEDEDESEGLDAYGEEDEERTIDNQVIVSKNLSTHEKEQQKLRSKIEQMEQANLDPKNWFMQGEVTAAKRPKNSALEVDLDFEHNVRPPPVITEEFTADIEELIKKRILEGNFDEVQKVPGLQSKAPKEYKEMDENKSKKGLAEIYEDEYVQKTGLVSSALTFSDEQKKEASMLFKKLCMKLDALSHFHFTPKPVIEDMSIQANVPALAMEEIAPLAVSDAAMLAPEEVYAGKGDIKEETELTQAERKRRRANKKRKYKAETVKITAIKKARENAKQNPSAGKEDS